MNWTEKQHGSIKLNYLKSSSLIELTIGEGQKEQRIFLNYKEFDDLREVMKEVDGE